MSKDEKDKIIEPISAEEFDRRFNDGEDVSDYIEWSSAHSIAPKPKRINVDVPPWLLESLDREAKRLGVARQALIKMWLSQKIEERENR